MTLTMPNPHKSRFDPRPVVDAGPHLYKTEFERETNESNGVRLRFIKHFVQGDVEFIVSQKCRQVGTHLDGRHVDRDGKTDYRTMLVLTDGEGRVVWLSPAAEASVRGRWDGPDNNIHIYRIYSIGPEALRRVRYGHVFGERNRTGITSVQEVVKVASDAWDIYRALNGDPDAQMAVARKHLPGIVEEAARR